ncbi:MAG: pre-peptidase C-terminal domain-containing protein [Alphaproteobacteria bacterium]|nr:pre-peptidase C-terminal domain-containing protein [Alphaproteobacteria bacterium]
MQQSRTSLELEPTHLHGSAPAAALQITIDDAQTGEGGTLEFRVHLNGAQATEPVSFLATTYLQETSGDYIGFVDAPFVIERGGEEVIVRVQTTPDNLPETTEVMSINIHEVVGATARYGTDAWAFGTILDDDQAFETLVFDAQSVHGDLSAGETDLYRFVTDGSGTARVDISGLNSDADLEILDRNFEPPGAEGFSSRRSGALDERVEFSFGPNELYYIRVSSKDDYTTYRLALTPEFGSNRLPTAVDDVLEVTLSPDDTVLVHKAALLENDSDPDGDVLTIRAIDGDGAGFSWVGNGTAIDMGDAILFRREGTDTVGRFAYALGDGESIHSDWALVTLDFDGIEQPSSGPDLVVENVYVNDLPFLEWRALGVVDPDSPFEVRFDVVNISDTAVTDLFYTGVGTADGLIGVQTTHLSLGPGQKITETFTPRIE